MSAEIRDRRPAVISRETRACLDNYRGFRHVVRNIYTFNLDLLRLRDLVIGLPNCYASLIQDIHQFCDFLEQLNSDA